MTVRLAAVFVTTCLYSSALAQGRGPDLSRQQIALLHSLIAAVDSGAADPESDAPLRIHLMRASDGSHYVAYTLELPDPLAVSGRPALYVRLASAAATRPERSPVREWLAANRQVAPPPLVRRGIVIGDMPVMGVTGSIERRPPTTPEMASLNALEFERRRARERHEQQERERREALEGRATDTSDTLPFEDFDFSPVTSARTIQRALTSGPGDFFLYVAWADSAAAGPAATANVIKKRLTLPAASTAFAVGSVILADGIQIREKMYAPEEQASHPYAIGPTEIQPAADAAFRDDEDMSVVFQVINARPNADGKPDVNVSFQVVRVVNHQERAVASLTPQNYSNATLPAEFDLRVGHPLFATVKAPLQTLRAGAYRLKIHVDDTIAGRTAAADIDFTVSATAAALLRDAPSLGPPFRPESVLDGDILRQVLAMLRPASPSPALRRAFELAETGRFVELMVDESVPDAEVGVRAALRGVAGLSVGDDSSAVQFRRAQLLGAPLAATRFLSGAARALESQDVEAIAAWQEALKAGAPRTLVGPQLLDAYLRRNDAARAAPYAADLPAGSWSPGAAGLLIASTKLTEAIAMLDARLARSPGDTEARWLLVHALFAQLAASPQPSAQWRDRFKKEADAYIEAKGPHAALAAEWLQAIS